MEQDPSFPPTRWSLVVDLREGGDELSREEALRQLCEAYWFPVYAFVRRGGNPAEEAKDLTQGFFLDLLQRETLAKADPGRGRMRSYLLTALKRYLAKAHAHEIALKRGGGKALVSLDEHDAEGRYLAVSESATPDLLFERRWAEELFQRAFAALRAHFEGLGKVETFEALKGFLARDATENHYDEVARKLGKSAGAIGVTVFRMRKRFRQILEDEIRQTLASDHEFEDELRHLHRIFQNPS